jgi:DNA-binding Lrp family transcriptional regulator
LAFLHRLHKKRRLQQGSRCAGFMPGAATAVPPSQRSLLHDAHGQGQDDSDDDLLASLGGDDVPVPKPTRTTALDDVDRHIEEENPFASAPTSVNAGLDNSPDLPSAMQTASYRQPGLIAARAHDNDFEMETTGDGQLNRVQATDDDFHDGKTKALVVDEGLLARLKAGDFGALRAGPASPAPAALADGNNNNNNDDDDDGFGLAPTGAIGDDFDSDATVAALPDDGDDDTNDVVRASAAYMPHQGNQAAERDLASMPDEADGFDDDTANFAHRPARQQQVTAALEDLESEEELYRLETRAEALQIELAVIRQRIQTLRAALEVTGSRTVTARTAAAPTAAPLVALLAAEPPRVGDSEDGSAEGDTNAVGEASLISLQSIDVHELRSSSQNSLLDELEDDSDPGADEADADEADGDDEDGDDEDGDDEDGDDEDDNGFADDGAAPPDHDGGDDLVSLAALQGALKEMGVALGEGGETQVAASVMPFQLNDDGGDVFGSVSSADSLASQAGERVAEMSGEATRVRAARPSSIALVVEDERARIRLRQHLAERFSELIEADSASAVMRLNGSGDVDAIVGVEPSAILTFRDEALNLFDDPDLQALAQRVHLSPSACLRRVKALEDSGVIAQYVALLNPRAVARHGTSYTIINLESTQPAQLEAFEQAVRDTPEILDCVYVAGANDYLVRFAYRDAEDLERFHAEVLPRLPGVLRSNSMLVLRTVKKTTALAL